jgi:hypothetical protein
MLQTGDFLSFIRAICGVIAVLREGIRRKGGGVFDCPLRTCRRTYFSRVFKRIKQGIFAKFALFGTLALLCLKDTSLSVLQAAQN